MPFRPLSFERQLIRIHLEEITDASELAEDTIRHHLSEIDARWEESDTEWSDEDRAHYEDKLAHDIFRIRDVFAQVLRRSLFISAYAILEQSLDRICSNLREERGLRISSQDLKDRGITRSRAYLIKVVGIEFPDESREWQRIKAYADLRNYLVHSGPELNRGEATKKLLAKINSLKGLHLAEGEEVEIEAEFLSRVVTDFGVLFDGVYAAIDELPQAGSTAES